MNVNIKLISVLTALIVSAIIGATSIYIMEDYGWTVFIIIPFLIGFIPPYIVGKNLEIKKKNGYALSFSTLGIALLALLIFALEGLICIVMASPILILLTWLGSYLGYQANAKKWINPTNTTIGILLTCMSTMSFDHFNEPENLIPVRTKIIVNAPIETAWKNVITFNLINEPTDWIFKTGISYPTNATIEGTGVGAVRYCNFTTGSFVEPITTWNAPNLLQFDVKTQPVPMDEFNPFWNIHPPHLDGYFKSYKGQFKLTKISDTQTDIEGTTWYKVDITPEFYWKTWSDFIIHRIHKRVLNHIKTISEQ